MCKFSSYNTRLCNYKCSSTCLQYLYKSKPMLTPLLVLLPRHPKGPPNEPRPRPPAPIPFHSGSLISPDTNPESLRKEIYNFLRFHLEQDEEQRLKDEL